MRLGALLAAASVAVLAALAGCSSDEPTATAPTTEATTEATTSAPPATRVWDNGDGTTVEVPTAPERIVLLDPSDATLSVARTEVGDRVVGIAGSPDAPGGWRRLRPGPSPTPRAVAATDPDLIVSHAGTKANARLAAIAPVALLPKDPGDDWRRASLLAGDLLGVRENVAARIGAVDERTATLRKELAPATTVSVLEVRPRGIVARSGGYPRSLLDAVGLSPPPALARPPKGGACCARTTLDGLDKVDADYVMLAVDPLARAEARFARIQDDPRFTTLGANQRMDLHRVDARAWTEPTLTGVETVLGDVEADILASQGPAPDISETGEEG